MHVDDEIRCVVVNEVPGVGVQLVPDLGDESRRPVKTHACIAAEADAQQMIEAGEVIHVRVAHEHVAHSQQNRASTAP